MMPYQRVSFSWRALLLAPWPALLLAGALLSPPPSPGGHYGFGALVLLALLGAPFAYAGTATLAVCLHLLGKRRTVNRATSCLCGLALAALEYLPVIYLSWSSSGPDSGPPVESFASYFARQGNDPLMWLFLGAGLITALAYDLLASRRAAPQAAAP